MRKFNKKLDNQLRIVLTQICGNALKEIEGFQWLTHIVNYSNVPKSLKVVCVFDTNDNLDRYLLSETNNYIQSLIKLEFNKLEIKFNNIANNVLFDTEENCETQHKGNWARRLN